MPSELNDSKDEVIERITQRRKNTDDSKESDNSNKDLQEKPPIKDNDVEIDEDGTKWETNTKDTDDSEW